MKENYLSFYVCFGLLNVIHAPPKLLKNGGKFTPVPPNMHKNAEGLLPQKSVPTLELCEFDFTKTIPPNILVS